ncbi:MAG: leucyl aminopeptidase family protein [Candidatus Bilamarchaeaceae archaeon]
MKIEVRTELSVVDVLCVPVAEGKKPAYFADLAEKSGFRGEAGKIRGFSNPKDLSKKVFLFGLGKGELKDARAAAGAVVRVGRNDSAKTLGFVLDGFPDANAYAYAVAEAALLAEKDLAMFKTEPKKYKPAETLVLFSNKRINPVVLKKAEIIACAQNFVRELQETPANMIYPEKLMHIAQKLAKQNRLHFKSLDRNALKKMGMNGILAVDQGSIHPPYLVEVGCNMDKKHLPLYCIVGKGVTFDSGGISIKPSRGMHTMKYDKTGALIALGLVKAISELKLPLRVLAIIPIVENMPSGSAQKPGDVIKLYNGKTVEVLNTDAEGRLILVDALAYAAEKKPKAIIDLATLTGAITVALGRHAVGLFSNDDKLSAKLYEAGQEVGEKCWRMPLWDEYGEMVKGDIADIRNQASEIGEASSITASMFLKTAIGETPWAHLDIAAVDHIDSDHPYLGKGGSGMGLRLVLRALEKMK